MYHCPECGFFGIIRKISEKKQKSEVTEKQITDYLTVSGETPMKMLCVNFQGSVRPLVMKMVDEKKLSLRVEKKMARGRPTHWISIFTEKH